MKQKKKEQVVVKVPQQKKEELQQFKFDAQKKSWLGPVSGKLDTLSLTRGITSREKQLQSQDAESLQHNRKKAQRMQTPNLEEEEDTPGQDQQTDPYSPHIEKPFGESLREAKAAKWGAQVLPSDRSSTTDFEKPTKRGENASLLSSKQQVKRLEKTLGEKDKDIDLLREQLQKAHRENDQLVEQLKGYRGKHYTDMAKENVQLRAAVERMTRQIVLMDGEKKKENNTRLQQMELERELEEKHAPNWQRLTATQQNEEKAKAMLVKTERKLDQ